MKLIMPTQMMGDTSTPPTGGTRLLVGLSRGSVGRYAMTHGILDTGTDGYQVITMRMMNSRVDTEKTGPRIPAISFAWSGFKGSSATPRSQSAWCAAIAAFCTSVDSAAADACAQSAAGAAASAAKPALPFAPFTPEAFARTRAARAHLAPPFAAARAFSARGAPMMPTHVADIVYPLLPLACVRARCRDPGCLTTRARVIVPWRA
mmetsp:Transcript_10/g.42  ORF Transcript_10/g.42 Transcript_10/m.42 type:complete len:206 (+) Transcript_10:143-760(+)